jgi:crossover junction endodeoxyribonuclease RuvC
LIDRPPLLIAGIDPGSLKTGYAFLEVRGLHVLPVSYGVIRAPRRGSPPERFVRIYEELESLLERFAPSQAAVEDIFHHKNARSAFMLGQARGVALLALARRGVEIFSYPPAVIKKSVTSYGRADKAQVCSMVRVILGLTKTPQADAGDALAVALTHAQTLR